MVPLAAMLAVPPPSFHALSQSMASVRAPSAITLMVAFPNCAQRCPATSRGLSFLHEFHYGLRCAEPALLIQRLTVRFVLELLVQSRHDFRGVEINQPVLIGAVDAMRHRQFNFLGNALLGDRDGL